jgi:hypothetical protein
MYLQELSAKQKKIDKNKNNKIDGEDLAHLRKEEAEELDELSKTTLASYAYKAAGSAADKSKEAERRASSAKDAEKRAKDPKLSFAKSANQAIQKHDMNKSSAAAGKSEKRLGGVLKAVSKLAYKEEVELDERSMSDTEMKKREDIVKGMKKNVAGFKAKYGERAKEVMYATATKNAMKEEAELQEANESYSMDDVRKDAATHLKKSIDTASDKRIADLKDPPKKKSFLQRVGDKQINMVKGAIKGLTKEEVLDEANHREFASQGKMHPDMAKHMKTGEHMDYYEPKTGDKVHGKVMKNDGKEVHVQQTHDSYDPKKKGSVHKFTVSTKLDEKKEDPPFDGPYTKVKDTVTDKSGAKHTPMSRAKHLAQQAAIAIAKKKVKEEFDMDITTEQALELLEAVKKQDIPAFLRKARGDKPLNLDDLKKNDSLSDKNNLAKARGVKEELDESVFADKEQATSVADKLKKKHEDGNYSVVADKGKHRVVHAYHSDSRVKKDIAKLNEEQIDELSKSTIGSYVKKAKGSLIGSAQVMGMDSAGAKSKERAEKKVQKRASGINKAVDRLTKEETEMNSFKSYMQEDLDEAMWPGTPEYKKKFGDAPSRGKVGTSSTTSKGTQTVTSTGVKHERDYEKAEKETSQPESGEKRGRGRPKGAASGARQKGSAAKADDRYDSTGFKLHLPNKNR